jgi:hypothetical protein
VLRVRVHANNGLGVLRAPVVPSAKWRDMLIWGTIEKSILYVAGQNPQLWAGDDIDEMALGYQTAVSRLIVYIDQIHLVSSAHPTVTFKSVAQAW